MTLTLLEVLDDDMASGNSQKELSMREVGNDRSGCWWNEPEANPGLKETSSWMVYLGIIPFPIPLLILIPHHPTGRKLTLIGSQGEV